MQKGLVITIISLLVGLSIVSFPLAANSEDTFATGYLCIYESEMIGTQTVTKLIL